MRIIKIALPVPKNILFSYILPEQISGDNILGKRALVPFASRKLTGVVVEESNEDTSKSLKMIEEILDEEPVFTAAMLKFTKWISDYYFCSWGEALKAALPQGMSPKSVLKVSIIKEISEEELKHLEIRAPRRAAILKILHKHKDFITINYLETQLKGSPVNPQLEALEKLGLIKIDRVIEKAFSTKYQKALKISEKAINQQDIKKFISSLESKAPKQALILSKLLQQQNSEKGYILLTDILREYKVSSSVIKELVKKDLVDYINVEVSRNLSFSEKDNLSLRNEIELELTEEQEKVLLKISEALNQGKFNSFLLHGVTGSGKTLIYFHAIRQIIDKGKSVLILVPEISLTPQLIDRFERVFPGGIAVFHSRMSQGERYDSWKSIYLERKKVVLGVRSAIFAPLKNLGLIIVDEEHEPSYKQDAPVPRYNARDVAVIRAKMENSVVLLGSATPSLESMYNALNNKYLLLTIKSRADGANLPSVKIVDIIEARKKGMMFGPLTKDLLEAISEKVVKKEGVILFQNRRGFAPVLECPDCAYVPECEKCSVSLTYHKQTNRLHCHYCGKIYQLSNACPACGYPKLKEIGFGTQRIEDNLNEYFTGRDINPVVQRMDLDTTSRRGAHRKLLTGFANGDTDILIGTQMVAKGLDFERVTLVGVINADLQLFLPDFRASERTFQLLTQVAGRAGRTGAKPGEVIIQTSHPDNFAISASGNNSFDMFYNEEIQHREHAGYPPFSRFCLIEFSGIDKQGVEEKANDFFKLLPRNSSAITALGPVEPAIFKLRGKYRKLIVLKNYKVKDPNARELRKYLNYAVSEYNKRFSSAKIKIKIDIDSFLPV
ncbi:primosomal protein N' [Bacteroidota bacterium]